MRRLLTLLLVIACVVTAYAQNAFAAAPPKGDGIRWQEFSPQIFSQAQTQEKLVLLDLEAIWCHWCHVMEKETYSDSKVQGVIKSQFIAVRADQAAYPELSTRYRDYGWPATIILNSKGEDLRKRAGFIPADEMVSWLTGAVDKPTPEDGDSAAPSAPSPGVITADVKQKLTERYYAAIDMEKGGLDLAQRYIDPDSMEFALRLAQTGSQKDESWAKLTLTKSQKILDPVWGGMYQYSTHYDWNTPHFEKIVPTQLTALKSYGYAFRIWGEPEHKEVGERVYSYLKTFLRSPDGAFYTSQDADLVQGEHSAEYFALNDAERRKLGIPAIDTHIYSRENGMAISGIAALYAATLNEEALTDAKTAAHSILRSRALLGGGFRHGERDLGGPFLEDSLYMLKALLDLYTVSGDRRWIEEAIKDADFIASEFQDSKEPGFFSASIKSAGVLKPVRHQEENILAARTFNLLFHVVGKQQYRSASLNALRWLSIPEVALEYKTEPGILLVDRELSSPPLHITIVGGRQDPQAKDLFLAAVQYPELYKRLEWWDKTEGPLLNSDVEYPALGKAAAFICSDKRCSLPIFTKEGIAKTISFVRK